MASGSKQSGLESRSESSLVDPVLTSWTSRESQNGDNDITNQEEERKRELDPEGELRELFRIFDKNHDNTIMSSELGKMLSCMGMDISDVDVAIIMKELDRNGNGKIEYREFKTFVLEEMKRPDESPGEQEKAVRLAFRVFDCNDDGVIDASELRSAMRNLGAPLSDRELEDMLKDAHLDDDGKINYEEFVRTWLGDPKS